MTQFQFQTQDMLIKITIKKEDQIQGKKIQILNTNITLMKIQIIHH